MRAVKEQLSHLQHACINTLWLTLFCVLCILVISVGRWRHDEAGPVPIQHMTSTLERYWTASRDLCSTSHARLTPDLRAVKGVRMESQPDGPNVSIPCYNEQRDKKKRFTVSHVSWVDLRTSEEPPAFSFAAGVRLRTICDLIYFPTLTLWPFEQTYYKNLHYKQLL